MNFIGDFRKKGSCQRLLDDADDVVFLPGELATSYTDMGERPEFFKEVLRLVGVMLSVLPGP